MKVGIPMVHGPEDFLQPLVAILRRAHAGELAAFLAYEGHWQSLKDPRERDEVKAIAREELEHRKCLRLMLDDLGYRPASSREALFWLVGTAIGAFCRVGGWFAPMYGAGRLESGNVREYEEAAALAILAGRPDLAPDLLLMAETEREHERYFRSKALERRRGLARLLPLWRAPVAASRLLKQNGASERRSGRMSAYLIARVKVEDPEAYQEYKKLAAAAIGEFGGIYRARGGRTVTLEGDEEESRVVVVEFPSLERGEAFYRSPQYQKAVAARTGCARGQFVLVEGVAPRSEES